MAYIKQIIDENTDMTPDVFMHQEEGIEAAHNNLAAHELDYEYQNPVIVGTQIQLKRSSTTKRLLFKLDSDITGGAITISLNVGVTSKPLRDIEGATLTEISKGFVEVVDNVDFFTLRPSGAKKAEPLFTVNAKLLGATENDQHVQLKVVNSLASSPNVGYSDDIAIDATGDNIAGSGYFAPYISCLRRNRADDSWAALTTPAVTPTSANGKIAITGDGVYIVKLCSSSPRIYLCKNNGVGLTKLTSPADPASVGGGVDFSPDGKLLIVGGNPGINVYRFANEVLTPIPFPDTFTGNVYEVRFSHNGKFVAIGSTASGDSFLRIYAVNGEAFTRITSIDVQPAKYIKFMSWNWDDTLLSFSTYYDKGSSVYSAYGLYRRNPATNSFTKLAWGTSNYNYTEALAFINNKQNILFRLEYSNPHTPEVFKVYLNNEVRLFPGGFSSQDYPPYAGVGGTDFITIGDGGTGRGVRVFMLNHSADPNIRMIADSAVMGIGICPKAGAVNDVKEINVIAS